MPVRRIPKSHRSLTGAVPSSKGKGALEYESSLERDFLIRCEIDPDVVAVEVQPLTITFAGAGGTVRSYTPDALIRLRGRAFRRRGRTLLCEVKYEADLALNYLEYAEPFAAARRYAAERHWRFCVLTERHIRGLVSKNVRFLFPFLRMLPNIGAERRLLRRLSHAGKTTPEELLAGLTTSELERLTLLPSLWRLIATKRARCDLRRPLSMSMSISPIGK